MGSRGEVITACSQSGFPELSRDVDAQSYTLDVECKPAMLATDQPSSEDARRNLAIQEKSEVQTIVLSKNQDRLYAMTTFISMLIAGWVDGSTGPLIPALQAKYKIEYLVSKSM